MTAAGRVPPPARGLGLAGLLPQAAAVAVLASGSSWWHFAALAIAFAYAALILSFLGGLWWGLAAPLGDRAPGWLWIAAVAPSLVAFAAFLPWVFGAEWPGPSLVVLAVAILASLGVDRRLVRAGIAPIWWMALRLPLSIGLGLLTLAAAILA
ncbi:MAG: DUF3429 domain-containing protein [Sphingomonas fennica]